VELYAFPSCDVAAGPKTSPGSEIADTLCWELWYWVAAFCAWVAYSFASSASAAVSFGFRPTYWESALIASSVRCFVS